MKKYKLAIVGATGLVGRTALKVLEEKNIPNLEYTLFCSSKSAGSKINFFGNYYTTYELKGNVDIIAVDFHAEATAEKIAMGRFLDGKITFIFGTHTHVQTADEQLLPNGTGYITDIGMTGPKNSVIGMDIQASIKRFETALPEKYKLAEGECILNAVIFNIDDNTNKVTDIERIYIR